MFLWRFLARNTRIFGGIVSSAKNGGRRWHDDDEDNIHVDLEELVVDYVWQNFTKRHHVLTRFFLSRSDFRFDISWNHLEFIDKTTLEKYGSGTSISTNNPECKDNETETKLANRSKKENVSEQEDNGQIKEQYQTEYNNMSDKEQIYQFEHSVTKVLKSSLELQEKYTRGEATQLSIDIDKIANLGVKSTVYFILTKRDVQEYSELSRFDNKTTIKVPPNKKAIAVLFVREKHTKNRFTVTTIVKPYYPDVGLPVTIRRAKDGRAVWNARIGRLHKLFDPEYLKHSSRIVKLEEIEEMFENEPWIVEVIVLTTRGVCTTVAPKTQNIDVRYEDLPRKS